MSSLTPHVALVSDSPSVKLPEVTSVAAALQKQVTRDFGPLWNISATVDAFDKLESVPVDYWPVILRDDINEPGAAGYHTDNHGQPFSLVQIDGSWPLTASHETLEMLADPFGSRTIAGAPPAQIKKELPHGIKRVVYLVEVCDPCEVETYSVNGIDVSDFISPHYYDPTRHSGVRYSFKGNINGPHTVLDGGYVSFGNPANNHWYQLVVESGKAQLRDLGVIQSTNGKSLRELIDAKVRDIRKKDRYRTKSKASAAAAGIGDTETSAGRAKMLRDVIQNLR